MKKKGLFLSLALILITIFSFGLGGCGPKWLTDDTYHWHEKSNGEVYDKEEHSLELGTTKKKCTVCGAEFDYTDEENFAKWIVGRDYNKNYDEKYTFAFTGERYEQNILTGKSTEIEALFGTKYYYEYQEFASADGKNFTNIYTENRVVKSILDGNLTRNKYVLERNEANNITRNGYYVSPNYALEKVEYTPQDVLKQFSINSGDTYSEICQVLRQNLIDFYAEKLISVEFSTERNEDGSIAISYKACIIEEKELYEEENGYINTNTTYTIKFFTQNGKLNKIEIVDMGNNIFEDASNNTTTIDKQVFSYDFDFNETYYNNISIETDSTKNNYCGKVEFIVNGYEFLNYDNPFVYDTYTKENALSYLSSDAYLIYSYGDDISNFVELYVDEQMTIPFDSTLVTEDKITLYVKLVLQENKSLVLVVENVGDKQNIQSIYQVDIGTDFSYHLVIFMTPKYLDGVSIGDSTRFNCAENKIYIITN